MASIAWFLRAAPLAVGAVVATTLAGAAPGAHAAPGAAPGHAVPPAPLLAPAFTGLLDGLAATSTANAWAVGNDGGNNTQILHWNGKAWRRVAAPNPDPKNDSLTSVSAASASDIWAVGNTGRNALTVHWNGKGWKLVPNPTFTGGAAMTGVAALSAANAWAVGATNGHPLIEHWNGRRWQRVTVPAPASGEFMSVSAWAANNIWAVGDYFYGSSSGVLIVHWNGRAWRRVAAPNPFDSDMFGVTATSASSAWAVGDYSGGTLLEHTLFERWNGKAWRTVPGPSPHQGGTLWAVAARTPSLAFAVGATESDPLVGLPSYTYVVRWNGTAWREVTSRAAITGLLFAVAFAAANSAWIAGVNDAAGGTLIQHWSGTGWR